MEDITWKSIRLCLNSMETPGSYLLFSCDIFHYQLLTNWIIFRLPDNWWDNFGPTPSADASGMDGICHDIIGTDGLAFSPGITEVETIYYEEFVMKRFTRMTHCGCLMTSCADQSGWSMTETMISVAFKLSDLYPQLQCSTFPTQTTTVTVLVSSMSILTTFQSINCCS